MRKDPLIFIKHILENIKDIEDFSEKMKKEEFEKDKLKQKAIVKCIEFIGEAVKNLPKEFSEKYPQIEWAKIAGTRDKIIHNYFGLDLETVWEIVEKDIPKLKKEIEEILKQENEN